jgi:hypothetical protein
MNRTLSQQQKDELRQSFTQDNFSAEATINKLVAAGYEPLEAKELILSEFKKYKQELFDKIEKHKKNDEAQKVLTIGILMISMVGPVADITSPIWYIVAIALCGIAGYFAFKSKPIAGILGSVIMPVVLPFVYNFYFEGRTSFIKIELAIPILIAALPAFLVYYIISKTVYAHVDN